MPLSNKHVNGRGMPRAFDLERVEALGRELLVALGEDPDRDGLKDTPRRWAAFWKEFIDYDPGVTDTTFQSVEMGQLVVVSGMRVYSMCEHHLLPFWCDISVGYISRDKVLGLSKFARIAHDVAHRLQLQERIVSEIADVVENLTNSGDVIVAGSGIHLCMIARGVRTDGLMSSVTTRGIFARDATYRSEFYTLMGAGREGRTW